MQPDRDPETGLDKSRQAIERVASAVPDSNWATLRLSVDGDFVVCHNRSMVLLKEGRVFRGIPGPQGKRCLRQMSTSIASPTTGSRNTGSSGMTSG